MFYVKKRVLPFGGGGLRTIRTGPQLLGFFTPSLRGVHNYWSLIRNSVKLVISLEFINIGDKLELP